MRVAYSWLMYSKIAMAIGQDLSPQPAAIWEGFFFKLIGQSVAPNHIFRIPGIDRCTLAQSPCAIVPAQKGACRRGRWVTSWKLRPKEDKKEGNAVIMLEKVSVELRPLAEGRDTHRCWPPIPYVLHNCGMLLLSPHCLGIPRAIQCSISWYDRHFSHPK